MFFLSINFRAYGHLRPLVYAIISTKLCETTMKFDYFIHFIQIQADRWSCLLAADNLETFRQIRQSVSSDDERLNYLVQNFVAMSVAALIIQVIFALQCDGFNNTYNSPIACFWDDLHNS